MITSASDESPPIAKSKKKGRRAIKGLAEKNPALLEAPIAFLTLYEQEFESSRCVDRTPALQYCLRQCFLGFQDICRLIEKRTLKTLLLRENIMNLMSLGNTMGKYHPETAEPFCTQLVKLIAMLEELDRQLAEASGLPSVNWSNIVTSLKAQASTQKKQLDWKSPLMAVPLLEDFSTVKTLGRGGFGAVYKGIFRDTLEVAIKIVSQVKLRFDAKNESAYIDKMLASVIPNHPFICRMFCMFLASGRGNNSSMTVAVTVMEAIDGVDITELVNRIQRLQFQTVMGIIQQLLMAIEHMHFAGFIHRDVKLANIILSREGRVKIIDFDVNKLCVALAGSQHQVSFFARTAAECQQGERAGTEAYMAPEVHLGKEFGRASDWWSVGVVFFRLTFGRLPFRGQDLAEEIVNTEIEWHRLGTYPGGTPNITNLKDLISSLLVKDPKRRIGSKDYNDIFENRLFADTDWQALPTSISTTDDMEKLFRAIDKSSRPAAKTPAAPQDTPILGMDDITDYVEEHQKLFTHTSTLIRELMSDLRDSRDDIDERDLRDDSISFRHCQHLTRTVEETTIATTTFEDRKKSKVPEQVIIQEYDQTTCFRRILPLDVQRLLCEDGMYRFTVKAIAPGVRFLTESRILYGDLIVSIDKINLTGLSLHRIEKLLSKKGAPTVVIVAPKNPFRDIEDGTFNFETQKYLHKPRTLQFRSSKKRRIGCCERSFYHGFDLTVRKLVTAKSWQAFCLVSSHDLIWQKCGGEVNVFTGDVVLAINRHRLDKIIRDARAEKVLSSMLDKPRIDLEFLPCSMLRTSNLPRDS